MIITFVGHRDTIITPDLIAKIEKTVISLKVEGDIDFYLGGYGKFDEACAHVVKRLKNSYKNIKSYFITPYLNVGKSKIENDLYDLIIYPSIENVLPKFAISARNKYMIECADIVIAYVNRAWGGAYEALQYAKRHGKQIINLSNS